jgi:hypothetical protein
MAANKETFSEINKHGAQPSGQLDGIIAGFPL